MRGALGVGSMKEMGRDHLAVYGMMEPKEDAVDGNAWSGVSLHLATPPKLTETTML